MAIVRSPESRSRGEDPSRGVPVTSGSGSALKKVLGTIIIVVFLIANQRSTEQWRSFKKEGVSSTTTTTTTKVTSPSVVGPAGSTGDSISSSSSSTAQQLAQTALPKDDYDPLACKKMVNGHCRDEDGKAWSYRLGDGTCLHKDETKIPGDKFGAKLLESLTRPQSVLDFGGGVGVYLLPFRDSPTVANDSTESTAATTKKKLVLVEPQPLGECLLEGIEQDTRDWLHTPLSDLPHQEFDLTMSIEVLEHIPEQFHKHLVQAMTQASRKYFVLSVAHPGQAGEGHVGPSMKHRSEWIKLVHEWTNFRFNEDLNTQWMSPLRSLLRTNAAIYQRIGT